MTLVQNEILKFILSSLAISGIGLQAGTVCSLKHFLTEKLTNKAVTLLDICKAKIIIFPPSGGQLLQMPYTSAQIKFSVY